MTTPPQNTASCPHVPLAQVCQSPTDELMGSNCMALISSPCASNANPAGRSLGIDPSSSGLPNNSADADSENIQTGFSLLYQNVNQNDTNKINLICRMLGLKNDNGDPISSDDVLPLSREFNGCNKSVIDRLRHRCQVHGVPLIQCNLDFLNNLWDTCKTANEVDTKTFDTDICPYLVKNDDNYALEFIRRYSSMTPEEREAAFSGVGGESLKAAWETPYIIKKLPGTINKFNRDLEMEEQDPSYNEKYFDELDVMQNCVLQDYTNPRHSKDYLGIKDFFIANGYYNELGEDAIEIVNQFRYRNNSQDGKVVNRFCDYGIARPPEFYDYRNPLTVPTTEEILDSIGQDIIDSDEARFSAYSGTYKCGPGTAIGVSENPYLNFEEDSQFSNGSSCQETACEGNNTQECMLRTKYHPERVIDAQLSEDDRECVSFSDGQQTTNLCPGGAGDCSNCSKNPNRERALWNSLNCKLRPPNPDNIYGHSCDDDYAACVRYEHPDELKKLRNQFLGKLKRDNSPESGCSCSGDDCTQMTGANCDTDSPMIQSVLSYPSLKTHNFLTDDMIEDRENLFNAMENPTEPIYKCMRCGLRGTTSDSDRINSASHIFYDEGITHSRHPDFLIFTTELEADPNTGGDRVSKTNCTANDIYWYQNEKGFLESRMHQDRTLREMEESISVYQRAYEESEENMRVSAARYEEIRAARSEEIANLREVYEQLVPEVAATLAEAERRIEERYAEQDQDPDDSSRHDYLFYIMGFIIFIILILILVF
jgi:hypothetical protein